MTADVAFLPLQEVSFSSLRNRNKIYVDKTALIYSLARVPGNICFLSRPRRFGKTLLLSTLESLFKNGLQDFKGLAIENLWKEENTYKVVRLNFAEIKSFANVDDFNRQLNDLIVIGFMDAGIQLSTMFGTNVYSNLRASISSIEPSSVVLLIDEYDSPLNSTLDDLKLFSQVKDEMSKLFEIFKNDNFASKLRFYFISGITRYSHTGIFSGFNTFSDLTEDPNYGSLLGYTEEEIEYYFKDYLQVAEEKLSIDHKEFMDKLRENYDGFCFEKTAQTHVYSPWSVLSFFKDVINHKYNKDIDSSFGNYWFASAGAPTVLDKYFTNHSISELLKNDGDFSIDKEDYSSLVEFSCIDSKILLTQAGYFTIKSETPESYKVGLPNKEVANSISRLVIKLLTNSSYANLDIESIKLDLLKCDYTSIFDKLNRIFTNVVYDDDIATSEHNVRALTQVYLIGFTVNMQAEKHNAFGRSDLEFDFKHLHYVFEFKFAKTENVEEKLLKEGIEQMKSRHYGEGDLSGKKLVRMVLVYSAIKKLFSKYSVIDE